MAQKETSSKDIVETPEGGGTEKYLVFTIQERYYALPSRLVGEAAALEKVFPLPLVDKYVRGIINRYSVPYALVDMGILFTNTPTDASKIIVLKEEIDRLAFLINDVADIVDIAHDRLLTVENENSGLGDRPPIRSSFEWKGGQVLCLDIDALLEAVRKSGGEAAA